MITLKDTNNEKFMHETEIKWKNRAEAVGG